MIVFLLIGLSVVWLQPPAVFAEEPAQTFAPQYDTVTDCFIESDSIFFDPDTIGFECGYVTVPELHDVPDGPTIRLPVAILRSTSIDKQPDPIFLAQGGPGGDAFSAFAITAPGSPLAADRDIVIFNQRGTKYAEPDLQCTELFDNLAEQFATTDEDELRRMEQEAYTTCRARLVDQEGVDLSAYDSLENAKDIDLIREALGYESYNFYGVSYGTLLGLHLMRLNPPGLRSVILDSVVPTQTNFVTKVAESENRAYDAYFEACATDADCRETYPDLEGRVATLYQQLNANPVTLTFTDDDSGEAYDSEVDGDALTDLLFLFFYIPEFYAVFPRLVSDMERGEFSHFEALASLFIFDDSLSFGAYFSVLCAEDADFTGDDISLAGLRPFVAEGAVEGAVAILDVCALWDVEALPNSIDDPVVSDIPTLLISGNFDPITPPAFAAEAAASLSNGFNVVNPLGSHGNIWGGDPCSVQIAERFLNNPTVAPDTFCYGSQEAVSPIDLDAVPVPILLDVANLELPIIIQFGTFAILTLLLLSGLLLWPIVWIIRRVRNQTPTFEREWARIFGRLLTLLTGGLCLALLVGFIFNIAQVITSTAYLLYGVLPAEAGWVFWLGPVVLLLVILSLTLLLRSWRDASLGGKIYQALLMVSLAGIGILLFTLRLFDPLLA